MISYKVKTISDAQGMKDFLELPFKIYKDDPNWVAPLKSEIRRTLNTIINPYFANANLQLFVCYKGKEPVARTSVVINYEHWKKFKRKTAFFGFFESIKNEEALSRLFEAVEQYCQSSGAEFLEGPFNPNHYSELGIQIDNFETTPIFFETYNPEYYSKLLENAGFKVSCRLHTRINKDAAKYVRQRYGAVSTRKSSGGFLVRHFNLFDMKAELERIREVYNDAFAHNWHFLPVSREEYSFSAKFLFLVAYPKLITIVEHNGEPVGILQCVLDINQLLQSLKGKIGPFGCLKFLMGRRYIRDMVIYAIGIKKAYQNTRVYKLLLDSMCRIALRYRVVSTTWVSEDNLSAVRASEHLGLEPYKWFAIYEKSL